MKSEKVQTLLASQPGATADTVHDAVSWAEACILATPGDPTDEGIIAMSKTLGPGIVGKVGVTPESCSKGNRTRRPPPCCRTQVLIDVTNPLTKFPALEVRWNGTSGEAHPLSWVCSIIISSLAPPTGGEVLAAALPGTHVFKAFNTVGAEQLGNADGSNINGEQLSMLIAGGPEVCEPHSLLWTQWHVRSPSTVLQGVDVAKAVVAGVGFRPEYVGPIRYARNLEAIAELWIHLSAPPIGFTKEAWGRNFHFQVIKKE